MHKSITSATKIFWLLCYNGMRFAFRLQLSFFFMKESFILQKNICHVQMIRKWIFFLFLLFPFLLLFLFFAVQREMAGQVGVREECPFQCEPLGITLKTSSSRHCGGESDPHFAIQRPWSPKKERQVIYVIYFGLFPM